MLVPCFNEEVAIAKVVADFAAALPHATIYVYDNNSTDRTVEVARAAGAAVVPRGMRQGKGHVVRRMFADVDADIYVLVDGDATYDAPSARGHDRAPDRGPSRHGGRGARRPGARRPTGAGHRTGNRLLTAFVANVFRASFTDILSGYRVFSRRFVKSFPVLSRGFEIETELVVHALELELAVAEIETPYYARPEGSVSKLSTWRDGVRILATIINLYRSERPLAFFSGIGIALALVADRPRDSDLRHLFRGRHRSAPADRDPVDRPDAAGLAVGRRRPRARYRHPRPARDEAARLSRAARAGRRRRTGGKPKETRRCANSCAPTMRC